MKNLLGYIKPNPVRIDQCGDWRTIFMIFVRVYFSKLGSSKILILFGGIKRIQQRDVEKSKEYLMVFVSLDFP